MRAWEEFLTQQERELGIDTVNHWLRSLKVLRYDACNLWLQAKDSFQSIWFEEHVRKKVEMTFRNQNNHAIKVHLSVNKRTASIKSKGISTNIHQSFALTFDELDSYCTFENFIQSSQNQLPLHILSQTCGWTTSGSFSSLPSMPQFNPIYIYGGRGSGKTHLLKATAHAFKQQGLKVIYVRAETFTDHVVNAIKAGEMSQFRDSYRNSDVLLIDDIQVLGNKSATQEELFHTFNALHLINKLIVISAPCAPQLLHSIEPRLISRFEWGIALPLAMLPENEWPKILQIKAHALDFPLDKKVSQYLAETFSSHPKACVGALEALILRLHLQQQFKEKKGSTSKTSIPEVCTISLAEHILADLIRKEEENALTAPKVIQVVADQFEIQTEDILGKAQTRDCALPRQVAMHFCRVKLKLSFKEIGRIFGRDHSTVMTSVKQIQESIEKGVSDVVFKLTAITQKLQE